MLNLQYLTSLGVPISKQVQSRFCGFIFSPRELVVKRRHLTLAVTELNTRVCLCIFVFARVLCHC